MNQTQTIYPNPEDVVCFPICFSGIGQNNPQYDENTGQYFVTLSVPLGLAEPIFERNGASVTVYNVVVNVYYEDSQGDMLTKSFAMGNLTFVYSFNSINTFNSPEFGNIMPRDCCAFGYTIP